MRSFFVYSLILLFIFVLSCSSAMHVPSNKTSKKGVNYNKKSEKSAAENNLGTVAVADIAIDNPSAELSLNKSSLRDTITRVLHQTNEFRVIDWSRLNEVLFRRNLEWSDVVKDDTERKNIQGVLLNDYFLVGSLANYDEHLEYGSSALSKSKTQIVQIGINLFIKDAITNEIVASGHGHGEAKRTVKQTLGFGAAGGTDATLSRAAANQAIEQAISRLILELQKS